MPPKADVPFNSSRSWLLGIFGVGEGSISLAVWSAVVSILLVVLYFNPWLSLAVLINAAIVYQLLR